MKTSYIAIIVVAIVAVAGVGVYFALSNNSSGVAVDEIKDTVVVGDYYTADIDVSMEFGWDLPDSEHMIFLNDFYGEPEGTKTGTDTIRYEGMTITVDVYTDEDMQYYIEPKTMIVFKSVKTEDGQMTVQTLQSTSLDIKKTQEEQEVKVGDTIVYATEQTRSVLVDLSFTGTMSYTVKAGEDGDITRMDTSMNFKGELKLEVEKVEGDNIKIKGSDDFIPKGELLAFMSTKALEDYAKKSGITIAFGQKIDKGTVDTGFGKRHVAEQLVTISVMEKNLKITILVGDKGAIYNINADAADFQGLKLDVTAKGSSLYVH